MTEPLPYTADPNRVVSTGEQNLDSVGLSFVATAEEVRMELRTGPVDERTVTVDYADIVSLELVSGVSPGLEIRTADTEYTVTNLASSTTEVEAVIRAIADKAPQVDSRGSTGDTAGQGPNSDRQGDSERGEPGGPAPSTAAQDTPEELSPGVESDGSAEYVGPSELMRCPRCGGETAVPDEIPNTRQEARCPKCGDVIGYIHESGEYVVVDPSADADV